MKISGHANRTCLWLVFVIVMAAPSSAGAGERRAFAGAVDFDAAEGLVSTGARRALDIDPALIARGDRLAVYAKTKNKSAGAGGAFTKAGEFTVVSRSGEAPAGVLSRMTREIFGQAYLDFELDEDEQLNKYLPFIQSMGDAFPGLESGGRLRVAAIDVVNQFGDRTAGGDIIFAGFRKHICARPQFECVDSAALDRALAANGAATSRNMDDHATLRAASQLGADVFVTGHVMESGGGLDFIALAQSADASSRPRRLWRRFFFTPEELGVSFAELKEVTIPYKKIRRGGLRLRTRESGSLDGMRADRFSYIDLGEWARAMNMPPDAAIAGEFFLTLDGESLNASEDGVFYDGPLHAGVHEITFGYYPVYRGRNGASKTAPSPVQEAMEITIVENENLNVDLIGKVEDGFAVIAAETRYGGY